MKMRVLCIGRQPQGWVFDAEYDYRTRLATHIALAIDYLPPEDEHRVGIDSVREKEGKKLLACIRPDDVVIVCDARGAVMDSVAFAETIAAHDAAGDDLVFVIGGSHGLAKDVLARAQHVISFSKFTFPHELFRVILLEQIYRARMITSGRPYHK